MSARVLGKYLAGTAELYEELGGNVSQLLAETGCPGNILYGTTELIPYSYCANLLEVAARQLDRADFALLLVEKRKEIGYNRDTVIYGRAAKTFKQAIEGVRNHVRARALGMQYSLETWANVTCFSRSLDAQESTRYPQGSMLFFASLHGMLKDVTDNKWEPSSVSFTFKDADYGEHLKNYFGCPIQFDGEQDAVFFPSRFLDYQLPARDDNAHELLSEYFTSLHLDDKPDFQETVKLMIQKNLILGRSDIEALALRLPYKTRTIQRKLKEMGTSYSEVLNESRFELAENLLANSDNPLTYIAQRLCFQDLSAFSATFKKRYGVSASEWKKALRQHR
ncbi:MAG: AraC family transcriptional regulator ligand-binding domain-containing protein [Pseudomonadales bacterium]